MIVSMSQKKLVPKSVLQGILSVLLVLVVLLLPFVSCSRKSVKDGLTIKDVSRRFTFNAGGRIREGALHVPLDYDGNTPYSLLFVLHGANSSGESLRTRGFDKIADELGFIVVYPDGIGKRWDTGGDAEFFELLVAEFKAAYSIAPNRIYLAGHSAGALKACELAASAPGLFTAIAPVAGLLQADTPTPGLLPVSVLHIHSLNDQEVPFDGIREWNLLSLPETVNFWRRLNGGKGLPVPESVPVPEKIRVQSGSVFYDAHGIKGTIWKGEKADTASLVYVAAGHEWPPLATEMIMDFFYNHPGRENRIAIAEAGLPLFSGIGAEIHLVPETEKKTGISKISYYTNKLLIGESDTPPFQVDWKVKTAGVQRLSAVARLENGDSVRSTINPFVLVSNGLSSKDRNSITTIPMVSARSSSDESREMSASFAVDGDFYTRWSSGWKDVESLTLDLGSAHMITGVTILWEMAYATMYSIDLSLDGKTWTEAFRETDGKGDIVLRTFPATEARYVRFSGSKRGTEWGYSFWELFVHGE